MTALFLLPPRQFLAWNSCYWGVPALKPLDCGSRQLASTCKPDAATLRLCCRADITAVRAIVTEMLRILTTTYREMFRSTLTDTVLLSNYGQTVLVVDELCKEVRQPACL